MIKTANGPPTGAGAAGAAFGGKSIAGAASMAGSGGAGGAGGAGATVFFLKYTVNFLFFFK